MAYFTSTQARDLLERALDDTLPDVSDDTFLDWLNIINQETYITLSNLDPETYITEQTITVISGTATYALPSTFDNIKILGCGLFETDDGTITDTQLEYTNRGSTEEGFYIDGGNLVITPTPTASDSLILRYIPELSDIASVGTSATVIKTKYRRFLTIALKLAYEYWDGNTQGEFYEDARFARAMEDLVSDANKESFIFTY